MKMKLIKKFAFDFCVKEGLNDTETRLINYFIDNLDVENDLLKYIKARKPEPPADMNITGH
jgi:hypothetical protein